MKDHRSKGFIKFCIAIFLIQILFACSNDIKYYRSVENEKGIEVTLYGHHDGNPQAMDYINLELKGILKCNPDSAVIKAGNEVLLSYKDNYGDLEFEIRDYEKFYDSNQSLIIQLFCSGESIGTILLKRELKNGSNHIVAH